MGMIITLSRISHNQSTSHTFFLYVFSVPHFSFSQENSQRKNELLLETTSKKFTILKTTDRLLCTTQWPWATNCYHADNLFQSRFLQDLWVVFSQSLQLARYAGGCFQSPKPCNTWGLVFSTPPYLATNVGGVSFNPPNLARYVGGCFSIPPELARYACRWVFFNPPQNLQDMHAGGCFSIPHKTCKICFGCLSIPPKLARYTGGCFSILQKLARYLGGCFSILPNLARYVCFQSSQRSSQVSLNQVDHNMYMTQQIGFN